MTQGKFRNRMFVPYERLLGTIAELDEEAAVMFDRDIPQEWFVDIDERQAGHLLPRLIAFESGNGFRICIGPFATNMADWSYAAKRWKILSPIVGPSRARFA